jgi:hypothetical protein
MSRRRIVIVMSATPPPDHGHLVLALRAAADNVEQQLAQATGLLRSQVAVVLFLGIHQPATIPDVAAGVGHGYRRTQDVLADLRRAGLAVRWQSGPARFALTDAGTKVAKQMNAAVWKTISFAHGWPAAVITGKVLDLLSTSAEEVHPVEVAALGTGLSDAVVAAQFLGVEPHVIEAWVRSGSLRPAPWTEEDLHRMNGLRGSVAAVWPELLDGARAGQTFGVVANRVGLTTQKVASAIGRDPALRAELDEALMPRRPRPGTSPDPAG